MHKDSVDPTSGEDRPVPRERPPLYTFFVDPTKPDKFSMARGVALLLALAAIATALIVEDVATVAAFLTAATACLGVRSKVKMLDQ